MLGPRTESSRTREGAELLYPAHPAAGRSGRGVRAPTRSPTPHRQCSCPRRTSRSREPTQRRKTSVFSVFGMCRSSWCSDGKPWIESDHSRSSTSTASSRRGHSTSSWNKWGRNSWTSTRGSRPGGICRPGELDVLSYDDLGGGARFAAVSEIAGSVVSSLTAPSRSSAALRSVRAIDMLGLRILNAYRLTIVTYGRGSRNRFTLRLRTATSNRCRPRCETGSRLSALRSTNGSSGSGSRRPCRLPFWRCAG